jgi:hypothetical protein
VQNPARLSKDVASLKYLCGECFAPLKPWDSVTIERRETSIPAMMGFWVGFPIRQLSIRVPICLTCWLIGMARNRHGSNSTFNLYESGMYRIERCHCAGCGRGVRIDRASWHKWWRNSPLTERVCCSECRRKAEYQRATERRRVRHRKLARQECGEMFIPTRADAVTCSNRCRQRAHRKRHKSKSASLP